MEGFGIRASYYLALSLMDSAYSIGAAFTREDLEAVVAGGHEIGSHTFGHLDAWSTAAALFEASILENQRRLGEICPGRVFRTFSFPINTPHPKIKKIAGERHVCCRGGGQTFNSKTVDLNLLSSYFVDGRNRRDFDAMKKIIDENCEKTGWLIFSTHDIDEHPSPYGCTSQQFEDLASYARSSGSDILPVYDAWAALAAASSQGTGEA